MKIRRTTLFAAAIVLAACTARASEKEEGFSALTVDQVSDLIAKKDADVFDNNPQSDWAKGHVPTAKWVSFKDVKASDLPADHARKLIFYCANPH